jgi:hypothetical protein
MKLDHTIKLLVTCTVIICLTACGNHSKKSNDTNADSTKPDVAKTTKETTNVTNIATAPVPGYKVPTPAESKFNEQRVTAFTITPNDLKITVPVNKDVVYGVIFDQEVNGAITTLAAYQNGDAGVYYSSGKTGKVKGNTLAVKFVTDAQQYLDKTTKAHATAAPEKGMVKFYLLTNKGIYVADEAIKNLNGHTSPWAAMFDEGNKVLANLKKTQ